MPPITGILLPPTSAELACICSAAAPTNAAFPVCKPSIIAVTSAPSVAGIAEQLVVEPGLEDAALRGVEVGDVVLEGMQVG